MSILSEYSLSKSMISGDLYHLEHICVESLRVCCWPTDIVREIPKSQSLTTQFGVMRMLAGLMSLCMMLAE